MADEWDDGNTSVSITEVLRDNCLSQFRTVNVTKLRFWWGWIKMSDLQGDICIVILTQKLKRLLYMSIPVWDIIYFLTSMYAVLAIMCWYDTTRAFAQGKWQAIFDEK